MKVVLLLLGVILGFLPQKVVAVELTGEELFRAEEPKAAAKPKEAIEKGEGKAQEKKKRSQRTVPSNLPAVYGYRRNLGGNKDKLLMIRESEKEYAPKGLPLTGEMVLAFVPHSLVAFGREKVPVVAMAAGHNYKGVTFVGYSRLEPNSQRIFIEFTKITRGEEEYPIVASGLDFDGKPGLVGSYHSREKEYFWGDFVSSFVAGYFESLVPKETTIFGTTIEKPSMENAINRGISSGAQSGAERFKAKLKSAPEFSELDGPVPLELLMVQGPLKKK